MGVFRKHLLWALVGLLVVASLAVPLIASDKPILASYKGELLFPQLVDYPETKFGGFLQHTDFRDPVNIQEIESSGWLAWPLVTFSFNTVDNELPSAAPTPPSWNYAGNECSGDPAQCRALHRHLLGTDDQGRDVFARLLYGLRVLFWIGVATYALTWIGARLVRRRRSANIIAYSASIAAILLFVYLDFYVVLFPVSWPSLAEMIRQAQNNPGAFWLASALYVAVGPLLISILLLGKYLRKKRMPVVSDSASAK